jgi:hypothetical protein
LFVQLAKRRVDDIRQRMEFMDASLRAQGHTQVNKMVMAIRELTVEEYCDTYGADTKNFLEQQAKKLSKKRIVESNDMNTKKRRKSSSIEEEEVNNSWFILVYKDSYLHGML